ncbi:MAG: hypothetical protein J0H64_04000 [Actinobacteria bacterium]|nr:hypothetical protein [Actinomycetota bacterium]
MSDPDDTDLIADRAANILLVRFLVFAQGLLTVFLSLLFFPVGAVLVVANGVMAFFVGGVNRAMFIIFAVVGGVICAGIALFLLPASYTMEPVPVTPIP